MKEKQFNSWEINVIVKIIFAVILNQQWKGNFINFACITFKWCLGKSFVRSKKCRKRKKEKEIEKLISKKREDARCRKMVSRRKLAKLEIRRSKKITKKQVPLSHEIKDTDVRKITEALAYTAKLKAKGQVKLF